MFPGGCEVEGGKEAADARRGGGRGALQAQRAVWGQRRASPTLRKQLRPGWGEGRFWGVGARAAMDWSRFAEFFRIKQLTP